MKKTDISQPNPAEDLPIDELLARAEQPTPELAPTKPEHDDDVLDQQPPEQSPDEQAARAFLHEVDELSTIEPSTRSIDRVLELEAMASTRRSSALVIAIAQGRILAKAQPAKSNIKGDTSRQMWQARIAATLGVQERQVRTYLGCAKAYERVMARGALAVGLPEWVRSQPIDRFSAAAAAYLDGKTREAFLTPKERVVNGPNFTAITNAIIKNLKVLHVHGKADALDAIRGTLDIYLHSVGVRKADSSAAMAPPSASAACPTPAPVPLAPAATGMLGVNPDRPAGTTEREGTSNPEALTVDDRSPISTAEYTRRWREAEKARKHAERFGEDVSEADVRNLMWTTVNTSPRPLSPSEVAAAFVRDTGWKMTAQEVAHRLRGVEQDALRRYVPESWHRMDVDEKQRALDEAGQN